MQQDVIPAARTRIKRRRLVATFFFGTFLPAKPLEKGAGILSVEGRCFDLASISMKEQ